MARTPAQQSIAPAPQLPPWKESVRYAQMVKSGVTEKERLGGGSPPDPKYLIGHPFAPELVQMTTKEIVDGITARKYTGPYNTWRTYLQRQMDTTSGVRTGSELNGLGRLSWFKKIMADPLSGPAEAEQFTYDLHRYLCGGQDGFCKGLQLVAGKLDLDVKIPPCKPLPHKLTAEEALKLLAEKLENAKLAQARAIAPLSQEELKYISKYAHSVLTENTSVGHTVTQRASAKQLILNIQKMDRAAMVEGLMELSILLDPNFILSFSDLALSDTKIDEKIPGVTGTIVMKMECAAGTILVGGTGDNVYELEKMKNVCAIIELGGSDTYIDGAVNLDRPVLAILDISGDDTYTGTLPGIQGSSTLGISILVDCRGNDTYKAKHHAQGSTIAGAAALIDFNGNDTYTGVRRVQGTGLGGIGMLIDRRGNDKYRAAMWSQGLGHPLGAGILEDCMGDDHYYTGGMYLDSYPETPGYEGWGQGLGTGIRGVAAGGLGIFLEGAGDDVYEFDYIAHGGGYWMGLGFFRDFGGNDKHLGSTSVMWDGSPRREAKFQRFSTGFGCHYTAGFFFEDGGDDTYWASIMSQGFAWDCGVAFCFDFGGNDTWTGAGSGNQGQGAQASLGVLFDYGGNDKYVGSGQGYSSGTITYHQLPQCGGNFSFLIDYSGNDTYGSGAKNNTYLQRGTGGGFLIDRPLASEVNPPPAAGTK